MYFKLINMNHAKFKIKRTKITNELKDLIKTLGRSSKSKYGTVLELTITDNLLTIVIPGIKIELPCETTSTAKASIGLLYFMDIIKSFKTPYIECNITEAQIKIGVTMINCQTTFFEDDSILRSIKLPINYTDWHLLQLEHKGFTVEELRFNDMEYLVHCANRTLKRNIKKTIDLLQVYGVTAKEITALIDSKIKI